MTFDEWWEFWMLPITEHFPKHKQKRAREIALDVWLASRKAALEEAAKVCVDRSEWLKGRQDGPPEELSNTIIRHHASASFADAEAILALVDNPPA